MAHALRFTLADKAGRMWQEQIFDRPFDLALGF